MFKRNAGLAAVVFIFCALITLSFVSGFVVSRADALSGPRHQVASLLEQIGILDPALATFAGPPYSVMADSTLIVNGNHRLRAKAYDAAGNVGRTAERVVNVQN